MEISRSVALVGRPNVGKSRLFNRLAGRRVSIVHDQPGVTRDLVTAEVPYEAGGYLLMDTGGIAPPKNAAPADIIQSTEEQVDFAVQAAGVILFLTDVREGLTTADQHVAEHLRSFRKPTLLIANKADNDKLDAAAITEFSKLGFGKPFAVSAEHGRGVEELHNRIMQLLGPPPEVPPPAADEVRAIKFALVGRPNVGKSSLGNALLKNKRLIVSDMPGTTRDIVEIGLDYVTPEGEKWPFTLVDTAGLRHGSKVDTSVEYFAQTRTREAVATCDVVFLVLDASEGVTRQDKNLAGDILASGAGLVIVANKWDLALKRFKLEPWPDCHNEAQFKKAYEKAILQGMFFLPRSPVIFTSAIEGFAVMDILKYARSVDKAMRRKLPTGQLNRIIGELIEGQPPKIVGGRRFKCYYALQTGHRPRIIRMYCNAQEKLDERYMRYLEAGILNTFDLRGCTLRFETIGKPKRERPGKPFGGKRPPAHYAFKKK